GLGYQGAAEPNNSAGTASPHTGTNLVVRANLFPPGDIDFFSFTAAAGDRIYAAIMSSGSAGTSTDSQLTVLNTDGTTIIEFDDDDGSFPNFSSSIAGAVIPSAGTYFLKVNDFTAGTASQRPYELHFRIQSGAPTPETEPNDTPGTANPLPAGGWVSGTRNPAAATEQDWYSFTANAGDTVYLSLDLDPEDDITTFNGRLGVALFGDSTNQILVVDDSGATDTADSEALFMTVKTTGTYFAFVDSASAATGGPTATYNLSVSIHPATDEGINCTTYTSTNVPQTIGPGTGLVSSTITVPGNPRIADVDVEIVLNHALMADLDVHLRSPAGNDNGLFTDIGAAATGGQTQMDIVFDDEAAVPPLFTALKGMRFKPENGSTGGTANSSGAYRLSWYDGENAGGTWTLDIRDDLANSSGGTLTAWSLRICEPPPPPACPPGTVVTTVFSTDFEAGAAGFTHSGVQDEWELGLPATAATTTANPIAAFNSCHSGVNCWKTDLDNTYNASSNQDLLSPNIDLTGLSAPVVVTWAQRHQIETTNFDHMFVDFQQAGGATPVRLYEWLDPTPISASSGTGNPQVNIGGSVGWGLYSRRADSLAGLNSELRVHLDSDSSVQFGGLAIDDVSVTACRPLVSDYTITKTDGVATAVPGTSVVYTIVATNTGPDAATGVTVADTFPASCASVSYSSVANGGATGNTVGPAAGNINDVLAMPNGSFVTYTATCNISPAATGSLANTATISGTGDPNPNNNSAPDTDTLTPQADLAITKTDGLTTAAPGQATTYTIVASNPGPSNAPGSTVADTFPGGFTDATWTCSGSGGTCTGVGAGNINDVVNLPAGSSVTYTVNGTISGAFLGNLSNTATVAAAGGVTDGNPANNSATDNTNVVSPANLSATKTVSGDFVEGGTIFYEIILSNAGPGTQFDNPGAEFDDTLPAGLTLVTASATSGTVGVGGNNVTWDGSIPAAGSVTITIEATIDAGTVGQTIANQGTIQFDADGDGTNESSGVTDDPAVGGATDPTEIVVGENGPGQSILEIPTLGPGALAGLAIALALLGLAILGRRRTA
ncbi:MAG: proprotein convertase P-domain-containing protein, partial [Thermoanaerobaculia bacterium]